MELDNRETLSVPISKEPFAPFLSVSVETGKILLDKREGLFDRLRKKRENRSVRRGWDSCRSKP